MRSAGATGAAGATSSRAAGSAVHGLDARSPAWLFSSSPHGQELYGGGWPRLAHRWDQVLAPGFTLNETFAVFEPKDNLVWALLPPTSVGWICAFFTGRLQRPCATCGEWILFFVNPRLLLSPEAKRYSGGHTDGLDSLAQSGSTFRQLVHAT